MYIKTVQGYCFYVFICGQKKCTLLLLTSRWGLQMEVSVTRAAELAGVSRTTLYKDMEAGHLSYKSGDKQKRTINIAELERVYGNLNLEDKKEVSTNDKAEQKVSSDTGLVELAVLRERTKNLEDSSQKRIQDLESQIEHLRETLEKAQEGQNKALLLLEDKSSSTNKNDEWQKSLKALESRIANQEQTVKEQRLLAEKRLRIAKKLKQDLELEKSKPFWKKLFG